MCRIQFNKNYFKKQKFYSKFFLIRQKNDLEFSNFIIIIDFFNNFIPII